MRYVPVQLILVCPLDRVRINLRKLKMEAFITNEALLEKIEASPDSPEILPQSLKKKSSPPERATSKEKSQKKSDRKQN
jgi:hypothetical protein